MYNLKNTLDDEEKSSKIKADDKKELTDAVDEILDWLEENGDAEKEDFDEKQKEIEAVANPIMRNMYQEGGAGGAGEGEDYDFGDDEL